MPPRTTAAARVARRRRAYALARWLLAGAILCLPVSAARAQSGPVITFIGLTKAATDQLIAPSVGGANPTYQLDAGTGFRIVIEARPGPSHLPVGTATLNSVSGDASARPDLQILSDRALGNGSIDVCDPLGGVPAVAGSDYPLTTQVADALNDFGCRFAATNASAESCILIGGEYGFESLSSTVQFCSQPVTAAFAFAPGGSILSVRVRDTAGNPGPVIHLQIDVGPQPPTPTPTSTSTAAPTIAATTTRTSTPQPTASATAPTPTATPSGAMPSTPTRTAMPSPSSTAACQLALSEADLELLLDVLFTQENGTPPHFDVNRDGRINAADVTALHILCRS